MLQDSVEGLYLSTRELRMVRLALMGLSDEALARFFRCSPERVRTCFINLQGRMGVQNQIDLFHSLIHDARFRPWVNFLLSWGGRTACLLQFLAESEALEEQEMKEDNLSQYSEVNIRKRLPVAWAA